MPARAHAAQPYASGVRAHTGFRKANVLGMVIDNDGENHVTEGDHVCEDCGECFSSASKLYIPQPMMVTVSTRSLVLVGATSTRSAPSASTSTVTEKWIVQNS